ncbi:phosphatase PAP2 family protein [Bdellovibrio sp. HCB-162]|uniref:phosphatase PAP2 family protein n=1 Tax=Bdellovibrio sp. HCB-162 TaxID=3394234 RepID=UPI0039BCBBEE
MTHPKEKPFPLFSLPDQKRLWVFLTWGTAALLGFPLVYGFTNYLAAQSTQHYSWYFGWETQAPFIPEFVWLYLSLNIVIFLPLFMCDADRLKKYCQTNLITLFAAAVVFIVFPTQLGFERVIPAESPFREIFQNIHTLDKPHNLVPSLHVTFSALALFAVAEMHRNKKWLTVVFSLWMLGIAASVVFTRQHHIADIVGGFVLAALGIRFFYLREVVENPQITNQHQQSSELHEPT